VRLRAALEQKLGKEGCEVFYPAPKLCTDNGAMIAYAGALRLAAGEADSPDAEVRPRWPMTELAAPKAAAVMMDTVFIKASRPPR
jgi:N6-L-threonylcarbamoyladenine synthase